MHYIEYGKENRDVIILLHGGGLSWWNYREAAEILCADYHVVLPIIDGHAQSDNCFTTIENNAADIIAFIDQNYNGKVLMIGGLSLGGQIVLEILSGRKDICRYALIESALAVPSRLTCFLVKPVLESSFGLIRYKWFAKWQFRSLRIKEELFEAYYRDTCAVTKQNMIAFLQENARYFLKDSISGCSAQVHIFVGEKENQVMKRSADIIHKKLQGSRLHILSKKHHGEWSINNAEDYAKKIKEIVGEEHFE